MATWQTRLKRFLRPRTPPVLSPVEGYQRWSATYGHEPNAFQKLEATALDQLLPDLTGRRVLDLGCGKGRVSLQVRQRGGRAVAADLALAMLTGPEALGVPTLLTAVGSPLPFRKASFDVVVCALVLGHVENLGNALATMADLLRPEGHLVISDFHPYATVRGWERTFVDPEGGETCAIAQHLHLFSDYVRELGELGLTVEAMEEPRWQGSPVAFVLRARLNHTRR